MGGMIRTRSVSQQQKGAAPQDLRSFWDGPFVIVILSVTIQMLHLLQAILPILDQEVGIRIQYRFGMI